jgi:hypothetical protein
MENKMAYSMITNSCTSAVTPATAEAPFILYHVLGSNGEVLRSVALDSGLFELLSVLIAVMVFVGIIRWVMEGDK